MRHLSISKVSKCIYCLVMSSLFLFVFDITANQSSLMLCLEIALRANLGLGRSLTQPGNTDFRSKSLRRGWVGFMQRKHLKLGQFWNKATSMIGYQILKQIHHAFVFPAGVPVELLVLGCNVCLRQGETTRPCGQVDVSWTHVGWAWKF